MRGEMSDVEDERAAAGGRSAKVYNPPGTKLNRSEP